MTDTGKVVKPPRKPRNYINNKDLYNSIIIYKATLREAELQNKQKPRVPDYIGLALIKICTNLAKKGNFSGYTYDLIGDGIVDCIAAVDNFNPEKTNNPFAYFTQIAWNAYLRRIHKEKKQTYIKHKNYETSFLLDEMCQSSHGAIRQTRNEYSEDIVKSFEDKLEKNKNKLLTIIGKDV